MRLEYGGMFVGYGDGRDQERIATEGATVPITVEVGPPDVSNSVDVLYRVNGGATRVVHARWARNDASGESQYFRADLPAFAAGDTIEYAAVCRCAGRQVPPGEPLEEFASSFRVVPAEAGAELGEGPAGVSEPRRVDDALETGPRDGGRAIERRGLAPRELPGRVLDAETGSPLAGLVVRSSVLGTDDLHVDLGSQVTDADGSFTVAFAEPSGTRLGPSIRLGFVIEHPQGGELHRAEEVVALGRPERVELAVHHALASLRLAPVAAVAEPASPPEADLASPGETLKGRPEPTALGDLVTALNLDVRADQLATLAEGDVGTAAELRAAIAEGRMEELGVDLAEAPVRRLAAHARLSTLPSSPRANDRLIEAGLESIEALGAAPVEMVAEALGPAATLVEASAVVASAQAQLRAIGNVLTDARVRAATLASAETSLPLVARSLTCGCGSCESALGPLAYLADLLDYALLHLRRNGQRVTLSQFASRFHQPFGELPASCEAFEERVPQPRLCVEVLRRYLTANPLDPVRRANDISVLYGNERGYVQQAYFRFLEAIGTSYDELRRAQTASAPERLALASRLGVDLDPTPGAPDPLADLFIDPDVEPPDPDALSGDRLDALFGLVHPTSDSLLLMHRLANLHHIWYREDWPAQPAPDTAPTLDPDVVRLADLVNPVPGQPAHKLWFKRRLEVDLKLAVARTEREQNGLDALLRTRLAGNGTAKLLALRDSRSRGDDIGSELEKLGLREDAFDHLLRVTELEASGTVLKSEWRAAYEILVELEKRADYARWRAEERQPPGGGAPITLTNDVFRVPARASDRSEGSWLAPRPLRQRWERILRARAEREAAVKAACEQVARDVEEATVTILRDALVFAAGTSGDLRTRATWVTRHLQIDAAVGVCRLTTRVAQAIETVQGVLFGARNNLLEDRSLTLSAPAFDQEWSWIGSYATWRAAMLVFLYPERVLRPSLRRTASPAFASMVDELRLSPELTSAGAAEAANTYAAYFADVCTLVPVGLHRSTAAPTPPTGPSGIPIDAGRQIVALGRGESGRLYGASWIQRPGWGTAGSPDQSPWTPIPGLPAGATPSGLVPYRSAAGRLRLGLYALERVGGETRVHFTTYEDGKWEKPHVLPAVPELVQTAETAEVVPVDPALAAGAVEAWTIRPEDRIATFDVDGDGRREIVIFGRLADGRREMALVRERDGGTVVVWRGSLDGAWEVAGEPAVVLTVRLNAWPWKAERLVIADAAASRLGILGWSAATRSLQVLWSAANVTTAGGAPGWNVNLRTTLPDGSSPATVFVAADLDGDTRDEIVVFEYPPSGHPEGLAITRITVLDFDGQRLTMRSSKQQRFHLPYPGLPQLGDDAVRWERPIRVRRPISIGGSPPGFQEIMVVTSRRVVYGTHVTEGFRFQDIRDSVWVGVLRWSPSSDPIVNDFAVTLYERSESGDPDKLGAWPWAADDTFYRVRRTGETGDAVLVRSPSRKSLGLLTFSGPGASPAVAWRRDERVPPGGSSTTDWTLRADDRLAVADLVGWGPDAVALVSGQGGAIALLAVSDGTVRFREGPRLRPPGTATEGGWRLTPDTWLAAADLDGDGLDELIMLAADNRRLGLARAVPNVERGLAHVPERRFGPVGVRALTVVPKGEHTGAGGLAARRADIAAAYAANQDRPQDVLYLDEAYYFVPVELALRLAEAGHYTEALDWFNSVYDYAAPADRRKIAYRLVLDEAPGGPLARDVDWLLDPLDQHAIAATRSGAYTRYTVLAIVECLLAFADAEFTRATPESVALARSLYEAALALLEAPPLGPAPDPCQALLEQLEITIGEPEYVYVKLEIERTLEAIKKPATLAQAIADVNAALKVDGEPGDRAAKAIAVATEAQARDAERPILAAVLDDGRRATEAAYATLLADPDASEAAARAGRMAAREAFRWQDDGIVALDDGATVTIDGYWQYVPAPSQVFCVPPNPALRAARLHAEVNLENLRNCRNIAGMRLELEPYAAPGLGELAPPGLDGAPARPAMASFSPLPYRYSALIERAKQLVQLAAAMENSMLNAIERKGMRTYEELLARRDLSLAQAAVRLAELRVEEAADGVGLAELHRDRSQLQADHFGGLLKRGLSFKEQFAVDSLTASAVIKMNRATAASFIAVATVGISELIGELFGGGAGAAWADYLETQSRAYLTMAGFERRTEDWRIAQRLARQDVRIGAQEVRVAESQVRTASQNRALAELTAEHAAAAIDFLATRRFDNAALYEWMSGVLESVYRFLLRQATAVARLAEVQLAFERQLVTPSFIKADYWLPPRPAMSEPAGAPAQDRRGLTGSARLLRDLTALDQYAFQTDERRLQLTKTISVAQLDPYALHAFRESGVLALRTPEALFDRDFPGMYLRLIRRVRAAIIALVPPTRGVHATLSTAGASRVVVAGDGSFPTVVIPRPPETVALTVPIDTSGQFQADEKPQLRMPFEGLGVDVAWRLEMPKASNLFDFSSIADVLLTIDYTALSSPVLRARVVAELDRTVVGERPFAFTTDLQDAWFDLVNPEQAPGRAMEVRFETTRDDFPPNLDNDDLEIVKVTLAYALARGAAPADLRTTLELKDIDGGRGGGAAEPVGGLISTGRGAADWEDLVGLKPIGTWRLRLPDTAATRSLFADGLVTDMLLVVGYRGVTPPWPA